MRAGKLEYLFFPSLLISAAALCIALVFITNEFFTLEPVHSVYLSLFSQADMSVNTLMDTSAPDFIQNMLTVLRGMLATAFENAPTALMFFLTMVFLVCPVYQGTVRYSAYLIEEQKALPLVAVLFYFTSPKQYFSSVLLSLRLFARKGGAAVVFFLAPCIFFVLGSALSSTYFGRGHIAAVIMLLSLALCLPCVILYFIYCERFSAARYIFALGNRKNIFKASSTLTRGKRAWLFALSLRLSLNLLPALLILPAPAALSHIINGKGLATHALISNRNKNKQQHA